MAYMSPGSSKPTGVRAPQEPLFIQYISAVTGHVYGDAMVDHLADMLLIMCCGGGTALGAISGASLALCFSVDRFSPTSAIVAVLSFGLLGSMTGCLLVTGLLIFAVAQMGRLYPQAYRALETLTLG